MKTYTVQLTVTDADGLSSTDNLTVVSLPLPYNDKLAPTANAGPDRTGHPGETITFDGGQSRDPDGSIKLYLWDMAGQTVLEGRICNYTFPAAGQYSITLTVEDNDGLYSRDTLTVYILPKYTPPPPPPDQGGNDTNDTAPENRPAEVPPATAGALLVVALLAALLAVALFLPDRP